MSTAVRFTAEQFDRVRENEVFRDDPVRRFELIFGEIREMVHPRPLHEEIVDLLTQWSFAQLDGEKVRVRIQQTLGIPELDSVPRPDIAWVRQKSYRTARPRVKDVLLIIEVSDTSLKFDLSTKQELYGQAGVREYWVVDVRAKAIHVFRRPAKDGYVSTKIYSVAETISPLAASTAELSLAWLFGAE
jgi:Uma2 family endonuclease